MLQKAPRTAKLLCASTCTITLRTIAPSHRCACTGRTASQKGPRNGQSTASPGLSRGQARLLVRGCLEKAPVTGNLLSRQAPLGQQPQEGSPPRTALLARACGLEGYSWEARCQVAADS